MKTNSFNTLEPIYKLIGKTKNGTPIELASKCMETLQATLTAFFRMGGNGYIIKHGGRS